MPQRGLLPRRRRRRRRVRRAGRQVRYSAPSTSAGGASSEAPRPSQAARQPLRALPPAPPSLPSPTRSDCCARARRETAAGKPGARRRARRETAVRRRAARRRYCPSASGSKDGTLCPVGYFCDGVARQPCSAAPGSYCAPGSSSPTGVPCPDGYQARRPATLSSPPRPPPSRSATIAFSLPRPVSAHGCERYSAPFHRSAPSASAASRRRQTQCVRHRSPPALRAAGPVGSERPP